MPSINISSRCDLTAIISDLSSGGAQRVLLSLANYWAAKGKKITIITFSSGIERSFLIDKSIDQINLNLCSNSNNLYMGALANITRFIRLRRELMRLNSEIVLSFLTTTNILTILASAFMSHKLVISERNDPNRQRIGTFWSFMRSISYPYADAIVVNGAAAVHYLSNNITRKKIHLIPNPVCIEVPVGSDSRARTKTILAVGRLHAQKGYDYLIKEFSNFNKRYPSWSLVILGDGPEKNRLIALSRKLGADREITFKGTVANVEDYYALASIYVLTSRYEGMPNALIEAMSYSLPAIITKSLYGAIEYVEDNVNGFHVDSSCEGELTSLLSRLADSESLRLRLGRAAKSRVNHLTMEKISNSWYGLFGWKNEN